MSTSWIKFKKTVLCIIQAVCENEGLPVDYKCWPEELLEDFLEVCPDLFDSTNWEEEDLETEFEIATLNVVDTLRFLGVLTPLGTEYWFKNYQKGDGSKFQKWAA